MIYNIVSTLDIERWMDRHYDVPGSWVSSGSEADSDSDSQFDGAFSDATSHIGSDAGSDCNSDAGSSDAESETSTIEFEQEPFETFQHRTLALARSLWPEAAAADSISVERLEGGGYNRIIGVQIDHGSQKRSYIFRIPRGEPFPDMDKELGIHLFVQNHCAPTLIQVPRVVHYDKSGDNEIDSPYVVQERVAAANLEDQIQLGQVDHPAKCRVARHLGSVYRAMLKIKSSVVGQPLLEPATCGAVSTIAAFDHRQTVPFIDTFDPTTMPPRDPLLAAPYDPSGRIAYTVHEWLKSTFSAQRAEHLRQIRARGRETSRDLELFDRWLQMADEMEDAGWFDGVDYTLAHGDLFPRNILFDGSTLTLLDWDLAGFRPCFMTCAPPTWLWAWTSGSDEDEQTSADTPPSAEDREIKAIFEKAAGPEYLRYAYEPAYRLARRLVRFAFEGLVMSHWYAEADEMIAEWATIRHTNSQ